MNIKHTFMRQIHEFKTNIEIKMRKVEARQAAIERESDHISGMQ